MGLATGLADEARHGKGWLNWIESRRSKWIVVAWGAALVLVLAVPVSLSRGGVVSLTAGLACFVLLRLWARKDSRFSGPGLVGALAGLGAAGLLIVAALPTEARARVLTLTGITSDQSGSYRLALWHDTLRLAASSPAVGSGFGAYEDALPRFKTTAGGFRVTHAENDHLELLAEGGLLAALLGAAAVLALLLLGLKALRATEHRLARSLLARLTRRRSRGLRPQRLRLQPPHPLERADGGAPRWRSRSRPFSLRLERRRRSTEAFDLRGPASLWRSRSWPPSPPRGASPRWAPGALARATAPARTDLRRSSLESDVTALLHRRPAHAPAWVELGWLRLPASREDGSALARWGLGLDPRHEELARISAALREGTR